MENDFIRYLKNNDIEALRKVPKSDLHNHATRGGNINHFVPNRIKEIPKLPDSFSDLDDMQKWYNDYLKVYFQGKAGFRSRVESAFLQAKEDGIEVLALSFGVGDKIHYNNLEEYILDIKDMKEKIAPEMTFIPEIAFFRFDDIGQAERDFDEIISFDYFKSIDLYGSETLPSDGFKNIFRKAKKNGFITKAHVGEFGSAELIMETVEMLELDEVQHGISAANSNQVMRWLSKKQIQLNICPTSNVLLNRAKNYSEHPIKKLHSNGVLVTVNTDDMLIFNQGVSEEYFNLYSNNVLSAEELNEIRLNGLKRKYYEL